MWIRVYLLSLVATPDRAWLTLLVSLMLLCREFVAPGRVVPGVLGGLGLILAAVSLADYRLSLPGLALLLLSITAIAVATRWRPWYLSAGVAAGLGTAGARLLIVQPWSISLKVALATVPAFLLVGYLVHIAYRARRNKMADADIAADRMGP